jgi:hypothetical protein
MKFTKTLKSMALAAVLSMGLGGIASANTVVFDNVIAPNIPSTIDLKFRDFDMGTVYNFTEPGQVFEDTGDDTNDNDINNPANILAGATGAEVGSEGLEDTWGIAKVQNIFLPAGSFTADWNDGDLDRELTIIFYNAVDFHTVLSADGTQQTTSSAGMIIDIYEAPSADADAFDAELGSGGRTGLDSYTTVTDGDLVLRLVSEAGHIVSPGGLDTEVLTNFNPNSVGQAGDGQGFFSVVGGLWAGAFDTNIFTPLDDAYNAADLKIQFTTFSNPSVTGQDPIGDWLVTSDDPATAFVIPLPGAASMGFGLMGLVAIARKRRSA